MAIADRELGDERIMGREEHADQAVFSISILVVIIARVLVRVSSALWTDTHAEGITKQSKV